MNVSLFPKTKNQNVDVWPAKGRNIPISIICKTLVVFRGKRRLLRVHWTAKKSNQSILKEINPKGNQVFKRILTGRTDAEAGTPILWPPDAESRLIGKDPDTGKD